MLGNEGLARGQHFKYDVQAMTPALREWDFPMAWAPDASVATRVD